MVLGAREQQAGRGEEPGERRHDRRARRRARPRARRRAPGPSRRRRRATKSARVAALLGRDRAERAHRRRVREVVDAARGLERREAEPLAERADRLLGALARDGQRAGRERPGRDVAEHDVRVGHRRLRRRRGRSRPGPGEAPALRGPTCRPPAASSQAIEPPPAPTSAMSIVGMRISSPRAAQQPAARPRARRRPRTPGCSETRPSSISDAFAVVPPRSKAIAFSCPSVLRERERGDDAGRGPGLERVDGPHAPRPRRSSSPPDDCMHRERRRDAGRVEPVAQVGDVAAHQRPRRTRSRPSSRCARTPAARAVISLESETGTPGSSSRRIAPSRCSCAGWRCACSRQTATASTPAVAQPRRDARAPRRSSSGLHDRAVGGHALGDLEADAPRRRATAASSRSSRRGAACASAAARARRGSPRS